ncbi:MAG TPA: hypothetical protein VHH55_06640 [Gaiellaceae bacterium]|jgi:hypothetical protein|nr:hypothetical protein [Gaiellaceae bacterium]
MRTRIIQNEPEPEPETESPAVTEVAPVVDRRETLLRRGFLLVAVVGYFLVGAIHPADVKVGDETTLYLWIHLLQPVLILLLAWGFWLLVKDLPGRAAQIARVAIVPYAIVYAMFDAIAGVAIGTVVREGSRMSAAEGAAVQRVFDDADGVTQALSAGFYVAAGLAWLVMAVAAAVAVRQLGGLGPTLLMAVGAAIFAVGHPFPPGPIGIALFGLGLAWLELRREEAKAPEAQPVPAP